MSPEGDELNEGDTWEMVQKALFATIKKQGGGKPISATEVLAEADRLAAAYFRGTINHYVLRTMLAVKSFPAGRLRIRNCDIRPLSADGARRLRRPEVLDRGSKHAELEAACVRAGYRSLGVRVSARTRRDAVDKSLKALGLLRGVWTLLAFAGSWRFGGGIHVPGPVGDIRLGPVHTLHNLDGTPVDDMYWFEPSHALSTCPFQPANGWPRLEQDRRWAFRRLSRLPYRADMEGLLVRYADALDHANHDVSFLHLWGILEFLTDTIGANYDETVARASWIFRDSHLVREVMNALRLCRNQYVHAARSVTTRDQDVYAIKSIVDQHLFRLLRNDFGVGSVAEYGQFIAQPRDLARLSCNRSNAARAIAFRKALEVSAGRETANS